VQNFNFYFCCYICHGITFSYAQKLQTQFFFFDCVLVDPFVIASSSQNVESVVLVVDSAQVEANLANSIKKMYEMNYCFQIDGLQNCLK
jgi:hypothetical protein